MNAEAWGQSHGFKRSRIIVAGWNGIECPPDRQRGFCQTQPDYWLLHGFLRNGDGLPGDGNVSLTLSTGIGEERER